MSTRFKRGLVLVTICSGFVGMGLWLFPSVGRDDAHITYWAARSLVEAGEIVNYNGARLEQSSSLLHTLALALIHWTSRLPMAIVGQLVSLLAGMAAVALSWKAAERLAPGAGPVSAVLCASTGGLLYWSFGGLDSTLTAVTLTAFSLSVHTMVSEKKLRTPSAVACALATGSYLLVRPEAPLVTLAMLGGMVIWNTMSSASRCVRRVRATRLAICSAVMLVGFTALMGFRLWYFGALWPQSVAAKVDGLRLGSGVSYLVGSLRAQPGLLWMLVVTGAALVMRGRVGRTWEVIAGAAVVVNVGFVLAVGGDWMEGGRMLVPIVPLVSALAASILVAGGRPGVFFTAGLLGLQVAGIYNLAQSHSTGSVLPAAQRLAEVGQVISKDRYSWPERANRVHLRDIPAVDALERIVERIRQPGGSEIRLSSRQAGMVPFHVMEDRRRAVVFVDRLSLTTAAFDGCKHLLRSSREGAVMTYADWFNNTETCGVPKPDVVYEPWSQKEMMQQLGEGYVVVFLTTGVIRPSFGPPGRTVRGVQSIAVRRKLAEAAGLSEVISPDVDWSELLPW